MFDVVVHKNFEKRNKLASFVSQLNFESLEDSLLYRNTRNGIYMFKLPFYDKELVLKRSMPNPKYRRSRVISFYLRNFFKHYGRRAFLGAEQLRDNGFVTIQPLAYWKHRRSLFCYESCLLYEKVDADFSVKDFIEDRYQPKNPYDRKLLALLFERIVLLSKSIHEAGFVHSDLVTSNFLVKLKGKSRSAEELSCADFDVIVIDTDHVRRNLLPGRFLKMVLALRCFRRINFCPEVRDLFVRQYCSGKRTFFWQYVAEFWRWRDKRPFSSGLKKLLRMPSSRELDGNLKDEPTASLLLAEDALIRLYEE